MAKNIGLTIAMGVVLIIMSIMFRSPGGIAGVVLYWVFYFCCMAIKGDSSDNSASVNKNISYNKGVVILKCPKCNRTTVIEEDEIHKCKYCNYIID